MIDPPFYHRHAFWLLLLLIAVINVSTFPNEPKGFSPPSPLSLSSSVERNIFGKNFTTITDAINDGHQFIEQTIQKLGLPSLIFGLAHRGQLIYNHSWGVLDIENPRTKTDMNSHYRICSISKTFTSALIGRLIDQGRLNYETPVNDILEYFPQKKWQNQLVNITIGQLLSHTSGLRLTKLTDMDNIVKNIHSQSTIVKKFANDPLEFEPGSDWLYSNYGFELLGSVIETMENKTYSEIMNKFLHQNGLLNSFIETEDLILSNRARYYRRMDVTNLIDHRLIPTAVFDDSLIYEGYYAAGGIQSTVGDLLKWGQLMLDAFNGRHNSTILKSETMKKIWSSHSKNLDKMLHTNGNQQHYGYGWMISNLTSLANANLTYKDYIWHNGGLMGTSTVLMIQPQSELVGAVLTNEGYTTGLDLMIIYMIENLAKFIK
ncbi:serine beta-lactamase-like protein LACTB, mitochondrial [Dermatophagoides pteronyssinus]|uniref:serine beta-lactamase-like protein LACTB, mitochondrial n=1 Tax=Dermatophagoides pteronyssinus TaxID=6956 RepID=UPI003F67F286